jgi:hypothetical protein
MITVSRDTVYQSLIRGGGAVYGSAFMRSPHGSPHARIQIDHLISTAAPTHPDQLGKELSQRRYNYPSLPAVVGHSRPGYRRRRDERRPQSTLKDKGSFGVGGPRPRDRTDRRPLKGTVLQGRTVIPHIPADLAVTDRRGDTALVRCASGRPRAADPQATNDMPHGRADDATEHSNETTQCERCGSEAERTKTITCEGRTWGVFCYNCHDVLTQVALGQAEITGGGGE